MERISNLLTEPSTWRGIFQVLGVITGGSIFYFDPNVTHAIEGAIAGIGGGQLIAGAIGMFTKDYKNTATKLDDYAHAAATGFTEFKKPLDK